MISFYDSSSYSRRVITDFGKPSKMFKMLGVICITCNNLEINNFFRVVNMIQVCEFAIFGSKIVQYAMVAMMVVVVAKQPKSMAQKMNIFFTRHDYGVVVLNSQDQTSIVIYLLFLTTCNSISYSTLGDHHWKLGQKSTDREKWQHLCHL